MKIAFVGKGGSGKTTLTSLFTQLVSKKRNDNTFVVDADLNMHIAKQLGFKNPENLLNLSDPKVTENIKNYLKGNNSKINDISHFRKTTPPTKQSNFINLDDSKNFLFTHYALRQNNIYLSTVGTYSEDAIGRTCYHDSLAILENILSHTIDKHSFFIVDMVAGIDAFAGSLHTQFDILFLCIEPTRNSIEVYEQYKKLAEKAGILDLIYVIANKIDTDDDLEFIKSRIPDDKIIATLALSNHIKNADREMVDLDYKKLETENQIQFEKIFDLVEKTKISFTERLRRLYKVHKNHVGQDYVIKRYGDLTLQIDEDFNFDEFVKNYE